MEFNILPIHRGDRSPFPKTPYVADEFWDGGFWMSYPTRKGWKNYVIENSALNLMDFIRAEQLTPTSLPEKESFLQTWLYFGLICQFVGVNSNDDSLISKSSREVIKQIYSLILVPPCKTPFPRGTSSPPPQDDIPLSNESFAGTSRPEDLNQPCVRLDDDGLNKLRDIGLSFMKSKDAEDRKKHYSQMIDCLSITQAIVANLPLSFNYMIRFSIASLGEVFSETVNFALERLQLPRIPRKIWSDGFLSSEAKQSMRDHGWCPSDIARAKAKYQAIQTLNIIQMLDRSLPRREHNHCTDELCKSYQIDVKNYQTLHERQNCDCDELEVQEAELTKVLLKGDKFPILKFKGDIDHLQYEIVESGKDDYIAISHVWADGLGNPAANSLHKCKLFRLQELASASAAKEKAAQSLSPKTQHSGQTTFAKNVSGSQDLSEGNPLIWLDTLCCPARGPWKHLGIQKIRHVYRKAKQVLVLDAGLMSYESKSQDWTESLARIFTSSWMRRLWTLQEGALAKSLYFQFADDVVSLEVLGTRMFSTSKVNMRYSAVLGDFSRELMQLQSFFMPTASAPAGDNPSLATLDQALMFRSVSVATDEPLCIATLMSLNLEIVLQVEPKENRMKKVWELISAKKGGIPAEIIFFEEDRIDAVGWRWAPRSLLPSKQGVQKPMTRMVRWNDQNMGEIDPLGLQVQYPGYRVLKRKDYGDQRPQHPWPGLDRIPEDWLLVHDQETQRWLMITDKEHGIRTAGWTEEQRHQYNSRGLFPLHDLADKGDAALILNPRYSIREGIFATVIQDDRSIIVRSEKHVMVNVLEEDEGYIHHVVKDLALQLRDDTLTDHHLKIYRRVVGTCNDMKSIKQKELRSEELQNSIKMLRAKMKDMMRSAIQGDARLEEAIIAYWPPSFSSFIWVLIQDFFNHDLLGHRVKDDQVWIVD